MTRLSALLFVTATAAFGQLDDNTITVRATRQITLQPDQIVFYVRVATSATSGIEGAIAKVSGIGITPAQLTGVFSDTTDTIDWNFTLTAPLSQANATIAQLIQLQQSSGGAVSFGVQDMQVSQAAQQSQPCSQSALVADAQKQAQALASAAGLTVGPVIAVSDGGGATASASVVTFIGASVSGILPVISTRPDFLFAPSASACTAVVKFQLYAYH